MKKFILFYVLTVWLLAEYNDSNALINETSPYLQQHRHNPVNWYPWGKVALEKAKKENKLIFLSLGYSTCHWCHVMEEESFTDSEIAKVLNKYFVSIKVDREEYPQIDKKYQQRYRQVHRKRGGWPLSVFLSPKGEVFHLATYIPKEEGYGSKGLENLLPHFVLLQKDKQLFDKVINTHRHKEKNTTSTITLGSKLIEKVVEDIRDTYDSQNGGFSKRPKFPEASKIGLLSNIYRLSDKQHAFDMAKKTLTMMAEGGIYDQIGGGFFRYTTDEQWHIPHFEKMLYTNAELISVYGRLYRMTGNKLYKKVIDESIVQMEKNYMQKDVYLSASDADSDGEEGGYFIYEHSKVKNALKQKGWNVKEIEDALVYLGIEEDGNIDGDFSHTHITSEIVPVKLEKFKIYLQELSSKRSFPFVDRKIITSWNAMMIKALFVVSKIDNMYLGLAQKRLEGLLSLMLKDDILYHQTLFEEKPKQKALLEDYAFLMDALIEGYSRTYNKKYLQLCETLAQEAIKSFYRNKRWYLSNDGIEARADFDDKYYTSALSQMLENLVRLGSLNNNLAFLEIVKETIKNHAEVLDRYPSSASKLVDTFLRLEKGDIIIHANKEKLLLAQEKIDNMRYPFVLSKVQKSDEYLACKRTMCFAHDKNITKLIDKIEKAVD
jgi:uncharacterized protein YyaL (SSP411 family)